MVTCAPETLNWHKLLIKTLSSVLTSGSVVAKKPRDASYLSVVSFISSIVQYLKRSFLLLVTLQGSPKQWWSADKTISVQADHEGESLEQVHDFKFLRSYKSADGDCTKEIKRCIALARHNAVVLASIWKDRNIKTARKSQ